MGSERNATTVKSKWADLKYRTKRKAAMLKNELSKTGGGHPPNISLNLIEERVLSLIGRTCVEGLTPLTFDTTAIQVNELREISKEGESCMQSSIDKLHTPTEVILQKYRDNTGENEANENRNKSNMTSNYEEFEVPEELLDKLTNFQEAFAKVKEVLDPLLKLNINSTDYELNPLDRARLNLTFGYALNSLFWMYLNTVGVNPKEHKIKSELERYKSFMLRIKETEDKEKAPTLDKGAAGRFIRGALWEPKDQENVASSSKESTPKVKRERPNYSTEDKRKRRRR